MCSGSGCLPCPDPHSGGRSQGQSLADLLYPTLHHHCSILSDPQAVEKFSRSRAPGRDRVGVNGDWKGWEGGQDSDSSDSGEEHSELLGEAVREYQRSSAKT